MFKRLKTGVKKDTEDDQKETKKHQLPELDSGKIEGSEASLPLKSDENEEEEDWQVICEQSLFANRLHQLEEICLQVYNGKSTDFINHFLRPVVELLDTIRSKCEDYYELKNRKETPPWTERFENIVKYAIHPSCLRNTPLHKGDFYIHISESKPRTLELKYLHGDKTQTRNLSMTDSILMCSENWAELLRSDTHDRFVFTSCILWTSRGFEKSSWSNVLMGRLPTMMDTKDLDKPSTSTMSNNNNRRESIINMEELAAKPILILDLNFELLHNQVAYLPGAHDRRGGPVIFFETNKSCWENTDMDSGELARLLIYYFKIPRESSSSLGCSLVIDARNAKQTRDILQCIGEAILIFQEQIPGAVNMAHVLTKKDSLMLLLKASKIKENLNFEFQFISSLEKLTREISIDELPTDFGGNLSYEHERWIKFRTKVEPFMTGCRSAAKHALHYIKELSRTDMGSTVEECEKLLDEHRLKVNEVLEDPRLQGLRTEGRSILERISFEEFNAYHLTDDYKHTIECLNRLHNQMTKVFDRLQSISDRRLQSLELCLKVRTFEEHSSQVIAWISEEGLPPLRKELFISDSLDSAEKQINEFETFTADAQKHLDNGQQYIELGTQLTTIEDLESDRQLINEKLDELRHLCSEYSAKYAERSKKLTQCVNFHQLLKAAEQWWMSAMQFIANMNLEDIQTQGGIDRLKGSFDEFTQTHPEFEESKVIKMTELAHHLGHNQVTKAEQMNKKCSDIKNMLEAKKNQILGAEKRIKDNRNSFLYSDNDENSSGFKEDDLSTESGDHERYHDCVDRSRGESVGSAELDDSVIIYRWRNDDELYDPNDANLVMYDSTMSPRLRERLQHIMNELISTEIDYVGSLEYILEHYLPEMQGENVPSFLLGKKNVLFGNIERIYDFHKRYFSQEVESYRHQPLHIGQCFLKWERQFYLYALYNKNKPKSDELWNDYANAHFMKKMRELKDKLDLASYLIKPVQRLGKYSLLLEDMIKCCVEQDPRLVELKKAHDLVKFQLRHGNDLLAMDSIRSSDVSMKDQGCLIRQADFTIVSGRRKQERRVFLFEDLLVFAKTKKTKGKGDEFIYKQSIKMVDLGLTENIGESGLRFEVWYRRWKKGKATESYILQAPTASEKNDWTLAISQILWKQATKNKEYGLTEQSTGISVESTPSSVFYEPSTPTQHVYTRRTPVDVGKPTIMDAPHNKRLSWISAAESSGSSGVHDLGSLPEESYGAPSPRAHENGFFFRGDVDPKYSSLPRKKGSLGQVSQVTSRSQILSDPYATANVNLRKNGSSISGYDGSFIRNNVYRKTFQPDGVTVNGASTPIRPPRTKKGARRRDASANGRYATQPVILPSNYDLGGYGPPTSHWPQKMMDVRSPAQSEMNSPLVEKKYPSSPTSKTIQIARMSKSITDSDLSAAAIEMNKTRSNSSKSEGSGDETIKRTLSKSYTDHNLLGRQYSKSVNDSYDSLPRDFTKRRSSFNKAMNSPDARSISVDERDKHRRASRQLSLTNIHCSPTSPTTEKSNLELSQQSLVSPRSERKTNNSPLYNLKARFSKSLSEM
uniref:Puratrophin protein n=1 Tax=Clytia hemisphaerica TaxID=252671 RepID=A0A069DN39_9CNID